MAEMTADTRAPLSCPCCNGEKGWLVTDKEWAEWFEAQYGKLPFVGKLIKWRTV